LAAGLDPGQLQLLAEDLGELLDGDVDLQQVLARGVARAVAAGILLPRRDGGAGLAFDLPNAGAVVLAEPEGRDAQAREGDRDGVPAALPDHLAVGDVLPEVL